MGQVVAFRRGEMVRRAAVHETSVHSSQPVASADWAALLRRIADGDQSAVAELYDATSNVVFSLALRVLGERASAEDVVIEVYAQVWSQAHAYDPQRGTPLAWLLTLTRSRAIDLLRARQRVRTTEPLDAASQALDGAPGPEENSSVTERRRVVSQALASLHEEQRQVIELAYFADLSHAEIAAKLGQPLGTVKTRIRTGLLRLRQLLGPHATLSAAIG